MKYWSNKGRREIADERVRGFLHNLKKCYLSEQVDFTATVYTTKDRLDIKKTIDLERTPIENGTRWGSDWESAYFRLDLDIPEKLEKKKLALHLNLGGEMLVYNEEGIPLFGMSNFSVFDDNCVRNLHPIGSGHKGHMTLFVECAANELFGLDKDFRIYSRREKDAEGHFYGVYNYAELGIYEEDNWQLYQDLDALMSIYDSIDKTSVRAERILTTCFNAVNAHNEYGSRKAREILRSVLDKKNGDSALSTAVCGHAHIDTAWLWPIAETHRKAARTFSSQVDLIERYPDYIFSASSPAQYKWVKKEHPELYKKIKKAVRSGRWEPVGGMWVEPDCNLISGESFARQLLHGKNFFRDEFGFDVKNCWIPDVFGYPASMPQILKKGGIDYFVTIKMSWSKQNKFPYDTFIWKGPEGSEVITHFPPEHDYNSKAAPRNLITGANNFAEKAELDEFLTLYGVGDGGGGPKEEHIERILRQKDVEGVPKASFARAEDFLKRLEKEKDKLETYKGELYLEYHRGTYTTQAKTKKNNRLFEENLKLIEALSLIAKENYPDLSEEIETALMLQFHDILPGSCIGPVYKEADAYYAEIFKRFRSLIEEKVEALGLKADGIHVNLFSRPAEKKTESISIYNPGARTDETLIRLPDLKERNVLLANSYKAGYVEDAMYAYLPLESGWNTFQVSEVEGNIVKNDSLVLENEDVSYTFDKKGRITKAIDKRSGKDFFYGRKGNVLTLFNDDPHTYEAWDIDFYYTEMESGDLECTGIERIESIFDALKITYRTKCSTIEETVILPPGGYELRFAVKADWQDEKKMLRVYFPYKDNVKRALCDIAYGVVERNTEVQTEWDHAKFEFPARCFVDTGDITVSSDCKYGYSARDGKVGITLLRSPLYPDPQADVGSHEFTYTLLAHPGMAFDSSGVREKAYALSSAILAISEEAERRNKPQDLEVSLEGRNAYIGAIKKAEKSDKTVIRIINMLDEENTVRLLSGKKYKECTLTEDVLEKGRTIKGGEEISLKCQEILTLIEE